MPKELTARQRKILNLIKKIINKNGIPPTLQELGDALGMAPPSVLQHIQAIEKKGFIKRDPFKSRSITVIESGGPEKQEGCIVVPIMGTIAAGAASSEANFNPKLRNFVVMGKFLLPKGNLLLSVNWKVNG